MSGNLYAHITGVLGNAERTGLDPTTPGCRGLFVAGWRESEDGKSVRNETWIYGRMRREAFRGILKALITAVGPAEVVRLVIWALLHAKEGLRIERDEHWKDGEDDD